MTDARKIPLPRVGQGPMRWEEFAPWMELVTRELYAKFDARNPQSDFASSFLANNDGTATIGQTASITSQRSVPMVNVGGRSSAQSVAPLTSTGSASTAAIQVAAHTLQFGFGQVAYGAGTVSGLTPNTEYHIYADDNYTGGAVAYSATTNRQTAVAGRNRYHLGSITTAISSTTGSITAATSASPISFTDTAHGLTSAQSVVFADLPGDFAPLNGNAYVVTVTSVDTFTVAVDGSLFAAYTSGGSWTRVSTSTDGRAGGGWDYNTGYSSA